jgi:aryl-alcohol dehydrogenase-like predicted oxidoreductase
MFTLPKTDLLVHPLCLGANVFGWSADEPQSFAVLDAYVAAGGNFIDTADVYSEWKEGNSGGESEVILGNWMKARKNRGNIVLATKVAKLSTRRGLSPVNITAALNDSLRRLQTDYVDIWQIQMWDENTPLEDTLSALDYAYTSGKARHVGLSNFSGWQSARAITIQEGNTAKAPIVTNQIEFSLLNRSAELEVLPCAQATGTGILAWAPLGRGVLTGKYRTGIPSDSRAAAPHFVKHVEPYLQERSTRIVEAVSVAAGGLGFSPLEVALAWVRDTPGITSAIVGARTGAQLRGILKSEEITLPEIVRSVLDEISA